MRYDGKYYMNVYFFLPGEDRLAVASANMQSKLVSFAMAPFLLVTRPYEYDVDRSTGEYHGKLLFQTKSMTHNKDARFYLNKVQGTWLVEFRTACGYFSNGAIHGQPAIGSPVHRLANLDDMRPMLQRLDKKWVGDTQDNAAGWR